LSGAEEGLHPLVYSVDGIAGKETKGAEKRLAAHLAKTRQRPYSQMVQYVKARMAIAVVRANSLLIRGSRNKDPAHPFIECDSALHGVQNLRER